MKEVKVLIGPAGCGKSTYAKSLMNQYKDQFKQIIVLSSDSIRYKIFGDLSYQNKEDHVKVFNHMNQEYKNLLQTYDDILIIYDATNLTRKRRHSLYNMSKKYNAYHENVIFFTSLNELIFRNATRDIDKQVPEKVILNMYKKIQTPQVGYDCDAINCQGEKWFKRDSSLDKIKTVKHLTLLLKDEFDNVKNELMLNYTKHDTPFHLEDVNTHIEWTIKNSKSKEIKKIAIFHDLGKGLMKNYDNKLNKATYRGHEMLGSYYALNYFYSTDQINSDTLNIVYTVAYHMLRRNKMRQSKLDKLMTSQKLIESLDEFNKVDNQSRIMNL